MLEFLQALIQQSKDGAQVHMVLNVDKPRRFAVTLVRADSIGVVGRLEDGYFGAWPWSVIKRVDCSPQVIEQSGLEF